ncbi:hypothetical protein ACFU7U_37380, partial [Streptomyces celluloflavus]
MMTPVRMPAPQVPPSVTGSPDGGAGTRTPGQPACSPSSAPGSADTARSRASKASADAAHGAQLLRGMFRDGDAAVRRAAARSMRAVAS